MGFFFSNNYVIIYLMVTFEACLKWFCEYRLRIL